MRSSRRRKRLPYFNPRAPCGARRRVCCPPALRTFISIHAPHAGRDPDWEERDRRAKTISIHAPHAGRDNFRSTYVERIAGFQSTRPMRGATNHNADDITMLGISIHAPHAGRDGLYRHRGCKAHHFNPRAPCGARHAWSAGQAQIQRISIHAPHAGRDSKSIQNYFTHFCDKRQFLDNFTQNAAFQSVLPLADRQKLLYLRCEPLRKFLRAFASHYKIIGSSGR